MHTFSGSPSGTVKNLRPEYYAEFVATSEERMASPAQIIPASFRYGSIALF